MSFSRSGNPGPGFSYPVGTGVFTDVIISNSLITSNIFFSVSNIAAQQANVGTLQVNVFSGGVNTLSNIQFANVSGFRSNTLSNLNASGLAFGVVSSTLLYGNTISNINSANITQPFANLVVSNTVTTTNVVAPGFTSNASNTIFNYSTLTVPFVTATTLNVSSTSNLSSTFISSANVSGTSNLGSTFITSANVSGTSNLAATFMKSSNISGTSNLATTVITSANVSGTSNMVGAVTVMGGLTTPTTSTSVFNGPLNFNSTFSLGVLAGNIRNILQGSSSVASVSPGPVNGTVTFGVTLTGTSYAIFFQPRYTASQTIFSITANTATTTTCSFYAYRITGSGSTCTYDWMLIDYNP